MNKVIYTDHSRKDLKKMPIETARRIIKKISFFGKQTNPLDFAKKLSNPALGTYRFRVGEYRVIFDIDRNGEIYILFILRIKHRKDLYDL